MTNDYYSVMPPPEFLQPLIDLCPPEAQAFLNAGGWLAVLGGAGLILLLLLAALLRRAVRRKQMKRKKASPLREAPAEYPPPPATPRPVLTFRNLPVRLRLIVLAPLGHGAGGIDIEEVEALLDALTPGLGGCVRQDRPRVRIWPTQLSAAGFAAAFRRETELPGAEHDPSHWVLLAGRALVQRRPIVLGLALWSAVETTLGTMTLDEPHEWPRVLMVEQRPE